MPKSHKPKLKTPRLYLSYSQMRLFEQSPDLYRKVYIEGIPQKESEALRIGKTLADRLESGITNDNELIEHLALFLPKYPKQEFEIKAKFKEIPLLGKLDGFDPTHKIIGEYKTGKLWNQKLVDNSDQLTFYSALVWLKYKKLPTEIRLHWAKTEIEDGELKLVGDIKTFKTTRTLSDIILLYGRVKNVWNSIIKMSR